MKKCPICGNKKMKKSKITEIIKYKDLEKSVDDIVVFECGNCGESFYSRESELILEEEFKKEIN